MRNQRLEGSSFLQEQQGGEQSGQQGMLGLNTTILLTLFWGRSQECTKVPHFSNPSLYAASTNPEDS